MRRAVALLPADPQPQQIQLELVPLAWIAGAA